MNGKLINHNRQAKHFFSILETYEAGIVLEGYEVKSIRMSGITIKDGFVRIENDEAFLYNVHITQYPFVSHIDYDPTRKRKLLLKKHEIQKLKGKTQERGLSLIPLDVFISPKGLVKITIAVGKGKKVFDKRNAIKKREVERDLRREHKGRYSV
ncbi:MAG: SsrA-binding protein SmpB [bacterium]